MLCFENQIDIWKDVWEKSKGQICPISRKEEYPQEWITTKTTKYTTKYDAKGMSIDTKDKSWTAKGIRRFNELFLEVQKDRLHHPNFIEDFIAWKQINLKKSSGSVSSSKDSLPDVNDDLFYDPDNLNKDNFTPISRKDDENNDSSSDESSDKSEEDDEESDEEDARKEKRTTSKRKLQMD